MTTPNPSQEPKAELNLWELLAIATKITVRPPERVFKIHFKGEHSRPLCNIASVAAATTSTVEDVTCSRCQKILAKKETP